MAGGLNQVRGDALVPYAWPGVARLRQQDVRAIAAGPGGSMWVSTVATVWRIRGNTAFPFDRPNGLPSDKAFAILDDGRGTLWMTSNKGLRAAKIADLDAFADGRLAVLPSRLFGASDGMPSAECMLASPGAARLADGTVWFPTTAGVVRVDPAHLQHNALPPPVLVEAVTANGRATPASRAITVPPGHGDLEVHYTRAQLRQRRRGALQVQARRVRRGLARCRSAAGGVLHEPSSGELFVQGDRRQQRRRLERRPARRSRSG